MTLILGIDTGGTYTDGVILEPASKRILCKAKSFTTKQDLMIGISNCIEKLKLNEVDKIKLVCLSTTLATNAIVEGRGGKVGLLLLGKCPEGKLPVELFETLQGKCDIKGKEKEDIRVEEVLRAIDKMKNRVDAIAISGYASVRNPDHELRVKKIVREHLDIPVVCAHELSSSLGFYDRTVTSVLNASLIPIITELIMAIKSVLKNNKINAPIMFVKGDGNLMQESFAIERPIESILSGPAASILGGIFLTDEKDALLFDMGGTTTDIANIDNGRVKIKKRGARVGGWLTQVQSAEVSTVGLGGDSYVHFDNKGDIRIGPQKVLPLCIAGMKYPNLIQELNAIKKDDKYELFSEQEFNCYSFIKRPKNIDLNVLDEKIIQILEECPHSLFYIARQLGRDAESLELSQLVNDGVLERISMTPTDILHLIGRYCVGDKEISQKAVEKMAQKSRKEVPEFLEMLLSLITNQLSISCLQSIADFEGQEFTLKDNVAARYLINKAGGSEKKELLAAEFTVCKPIVAVGAPVRAWMPAVCERLHTNLIIPEHAEVANAVGAAVGQVMETMEVIIRPDGEHKGYILHAPWECNIFDTLEEAKEYAISAIKRHVADLAIRAGSDKFEVVETHKDIYSDVTSTKERIFIETRLRATAIGSQIWIT